MAAIIAGSIFAFLLFCGFARYVGLFSDYIPLPEKHRDLASFVFGLLGAAMILYCSL